MALEELYREVILDHYRSPRNRAPLADADAHAEGVNPLCGDEITVDIGWTEEGHIGQISVRGQGCSISQASASMMSEAVKDKNRAEVSELIGKFKAMMDIDGTPLETDPDQPGSVLGDLEALQGVRRYPVRIKCANLAWTTLEEALS